MTVFGTKEKIIIIIKIPVGPSSLISNVQICSSSEHGHQIQWVLEFKNQDIWLELLTQANDIYKSLKLVFGLPFHRLLFLLNYFKRHTLFLPFLIEQSGKKTSDLFVRLLYISSFFE